MINGKKEENLKKENRTLVLSESALLIFEPNKSCTAAEQNAILLFWSDLFSLKDLKRNQQKQNLITFCWEEAETMRKHEEKLEIEETDIFIKKLLENMDKLGAAIRTSKGGYINKSIPSKEEITSIIDMITELEKLYDADPAQETFDELKGLYQKVEEYYLLIGSKETEEWNEKIKLLTQKNNYNQS